MRPITWNVISTITRRSLCLPTRTYATADPNKIFSGLGNTISAFDKSAMLTGETAPEFVTFFVPAPQTPFTHSHMLAADLEGTRLPPDNTPEYIVQVQDDTLGFPADRLQVYEFHVNWKDPSSSTLVPTDSLAPDPFNCNACVNQDCIEQPGIPTLLDSLSYGYMMQRLTYRNFGDHQMLLLNHTVAANGDPTQNHAGIRWYELRMGTPGPWEIYQQGTYAPDANDRWLGSIAMDKHGNIALGFHVSGADIFPSLHYAGRRPTDPPGILSQGELTLIDGNGAQLNTSFFGDYSQMTIDPTDDWYVLVHGHLLSRDRQRRPLAHANWRVQVRRLHSITTAAPDSVSAPNSAVMQD